VNVGTPAVVAVGDGSHARLRPLGMGDVEIGGGLWAERQRLNRELTLPHGAEQLERAGNFENLRLAAGTSHGAYSGLPLPFLDSDVYKWLEAVSWELGRAPSPGLAALADRAIDLVAAAQAGDGYLDSYYQVLKPDVRYAELPMGHELYCAGHLVQAAVARARTTGRTDLLAIATRFVDNIDAAIGPAGRPGVCGHPEIEMALVELHRLTGDERHLALASCFLDRRGHGLLGPGTYGPAYYQDDRPVREATTVTGHAVRALYLACGVTDAFLETGERALLDASIAQWEDMVATRTYLTGGLGSRHRDESFGDPYELPPDRAYCETCAAIASIMWSWRLLLATGEARYADLIERTLYNGFLAGVSLDGLSFFYVNPLQLRAAHQQPWNNRGSAERAGWYRCACCPPNVMRLLSSLQQYVATAGGRGVQLHQHVPGTVRASLAGGEAVELDVATDYPWSGRVEVTVARTGGGEWSLALRVPEWCRGARLSAGAEERRDLAPGAYATVTRSWRPGDRVVLELPVAARLTEPHPRVDAVRGCVAIERGPLVYCLEQVDLPAGVAMADVALVPGAELREGSEPDLLGGVVTVRTEGVRRSTGEWGGWPYRDQGGAEHDRAGEPVGLAAIPYFAWANRTPGPMRVWIPGAASASGEGEKR
jgi:uncharacterized protein